MKRYLNISKHKTLQNLVFAWLLFSFSGCWIFTGEAPLNENVLTGNTIPERENELTQEINTIATYRFGDILYDLEIVESKLLTRRQFFGEFTVNIEASTENSQVKKFTGKLMSMNRRGFQGKAVL